MIEITFWAAVAAGILAIGVGIYTLWDVYGKSNLLENNIERNKSTMNNSNNAQAKEYGLLNKLFYWLMVSSMVAVPGIVAIMVSGFNQWIPVLLVPALLLLDVFGKPEPTSTGELTARTRRIRLAATGFAVLSIVIAAAAGVGGIQASWWGLLLILPGLVVTGVFAGTIRDTIKNTFRFARLGNLAVLALYVVAGAWTLSVAEALFPTIVSVQSAYIATLYVVGATVVLCIALTPRQILTPRLWLPELIHDENESE